MTVKRVMGTETEYAVSLNTPDRYNPVQLSFDVVNGAADSHSKSIRWDYRQEDPVSNAPPPARTCSPTPRSSTSPT
mgnify:CR=1 FL=1